MSINLVASGTDRVNYGSIDSLIHGLSQITVACVCNISAAASDERFVSAWGGLLSGFIVHIRPSTDELGFVTVTTGGSAGRSTTALNITSGLYRIVITAILNTGPTFEMWVNGNQESDEEWLDSATGTLIATFSVDLTIAYDPNETIDGVDGDYQDVAIWNRALTSGEAAAISGAALSPLAVPRGLLFYSRLTNTNDLDDVVAGLSGTLTGGANANHQRVLMPSAQILQFPPATGLAITSVGGDDEFDSGEQNIQIVGTGFIP